MNKVFLPPSQCGSLKLIQITDAHLYGPVGGELLGVNTLDSFDAVLNAVKQEEQDVDAILATGDISQDHSEQSYLHFVERITSFKQPCYWLPGNHDYQPVMKKALEEASISPANQVVSEYWQLILLDTQVEGVPHGRVSQQQMQVLQQALEEYPDKYCLILLHHHSIAAGCAWLDQHDIKNAEVLFELLAQYPQAKAMLCGHIHQEMDQVKNGIRQLASPSTCIQFRPNSDDFALDDSAPGWRYLDLAPDGSIKTQVKRLPHGSFIPLADAEGY